MEICIFKVYDFSSIQCLNIGISLIFHSPLELSNQKNFCKFEMALRGV